jgi:hypothetical protein
MHLSMKACVPPTSLTRADCHSLPKTMLTSKLALSSLQSKDSGLLGQYYSNHRYGSNNARSHDQHFEGRRKKNIRSRIKGIKYKI